MEFEKIKVFKYIQASSIFKYFFKICSILIKNFLVFLNPLKLGKKLDEFFHNELIQLLFHKHLRARGGGGSDSGGLRSIFNNPVFKNVF